VVIVSHKVHALIILQMGGVLGWKMFFEWVSDGL